MASKYAAYFAVEKQVMQQTGNSLDREDLIAQFTDNRKSSLSDLTAFEYKEFLNWLKTAFKPKPKADWQDTPENRMRRKIISLFMHMRYTLPNGKADMDKINDWCIKYSLTHKPLNDNNATDLTRIVTQAQFVYKSFLKNLNK